MPVALRRRSLIWNKASKNRRPRGAWLSCFGTTWVGEGYLFSGRSEDAVRLADRAVELSRQHKERGHEAWARKLLGDIAMQEDRRDPAQAGSALSGGAGAVR